MILAESLLELVLEGICEHSQAMCYGRRFEVNPSEVLLDKTYHYYTMAKLEEKWKCCHLDIVHVSLLLLQGFLLNQLELLEIYVHVVDGRVFHVKPETRIPKHLDSFKGLTA